MKTRDLAYGLALSGALFAGAVEAGSAVQQWQFDRLMNPTPGDLALERNGKVMIYEGLTDRQVSRALDGHFDRIDAMMFVGVVLTDPVGQPRRNPETGGLVTEDDGCD